MATMDFNKLITRRFCSRFTTYTHWFNSESDIREQAKEKLFNDLIREIYKFVGDNEVVIHIHPSGMAYDSYMEIEKFADVSLIIRCKDCDNYRCGTCIKDWRKTEPECHCSNAIKKLEECDSLEID